MYQSRGSVDSSTTKNLNRSDRFNQMTKQQQMIEEKKRQIQLRLEMQKKKDSDSSEEKAKESEAKVERKPLVFSNDGSFLDQFKKIAQSGIAGSQNTTPLGSSQSPLALQNNNSREGHQQQTPGVFPQMFPPGCPPPQFPPFQQLPPPQFQYPQFSMPPPPPGSLPLTSLPPPAPSLGIPPPPIPPCFGPPPPPPLHQFQPTPPQMPPFAVPPPQVLNNLQVPPESASQEEDRRSGRGRQERDEEGRAGQLGRENFSPTRPPPNRHFNHHQQQQQQQQQHQQQHPQHQQQRGHRPYPSPRPHRSDSHWYEEDERERERERERPGRGGRGRGRWSPERYDGRGERQDYHRGEYHQQGGGGGRREGRDRHLPIPSLMATEIKPPPSLMATEIKPPPSLLHHNNNDKSESGIVSYPLRQEEEEPRELGGLKPETGPKMEEVMVTSYPLRQPPISRPPPPTVPSPQESDSQPLLPGLSAAVPPPAFVRPPPETDSSDAERRRQERKRKSRWSEDKVDIPPPAAAPVPPPNAPKINVPGMHGHMLSKVTRTDPGLLQYALNAYGSTNLSDEDWKKAEENYKVHLLYQDMMAKRAEVEKLRQCGKPKYEYDSDEEIDEGGTWEHKLREKEMTATQQWAESLTEMAKGKHHIGDFLPPDELSKFLAKYQAAKGGKEPDLSDYKEYKLGQENKGFQMLQKLGWSEGQGLGSEGAGRLEPVNKSQSRDFNEGLGHARPDDVSNEDDEYDAYRKRMMLAYRFRPNPLNNPRRPYY